MCGNYKVKSLHIMLLKPSAYVKSYDSQTTCIYFLTEDDNLLKNIILFEIKSVLTLKKKSDGETAYNNFFLKTKIKSYGDEATCFYCKKCLK